MPDDPNGLGSELDSSPANGLPPEIAELVGGMRGIDDVFAPEEQGSEQTPGARASQEDRGRPADATAARGSDETTTDGGETPTTDDSDAGAHDDQADPLSERVADGLSDDEWESAPDRVREILEQFTRGDKRAVFGHITKVVKTEVQKDIDAAQQRADELKAENEKREAEARTVREKAGQFVGADVVEERDRNGNVVRRLPSYDEVQRLISARNGDEVLADTWDMSREEALDWRDTLEERRSVLDASAGHFADKAWVDLAARLETGLKAIEGIDPQAMVAGAKGPHDVVARLAAAINSKWERREAALKRDYEGRLEAFRGNDTGKRARELAGSRAPATGGRSGGGASKALPSRPGDVLAMSDADFLANKDELLALIK